MLLNDLHRLQADFEKELALCRDMNALAACEQGYFSRVAGKLSLLMKGLGSLSPLERNETGRKMNETKREMERVLKNKKDELWDLSVGEMMVEEAIDVTQPSLSKEEAGHLHPNSQVQYALEDLFTSMGFMVLDGPELESEYFNFTALNIPADHPARDSQDTFYVKDEPGLLMRTHTSPMQVRAMREYGAPLRMIVPGKCFRNEATDARHEHTFYQLEGVMIGEKITFADMKGILEVVAKYLYGAKTEVRLRPKFYPFVEPGVNGEVTCFLCKGNGCRVCKSTGWLEIFGAGMIHSNVLAAGNIDAAKYQGFAFGLGLTRLVMLKYGIEDIRHLESGDLRFLSQF